MCFLKELLERDGYKLVHWKDGKAGHNYVSVFDYSEQNGGTYDSFRFYNDYVVDVTKNN